MEGEEKEAYNFLCHAMIFFLLWRKKKRFSSSAVVVAGAVVISGSLAYHDGVPSFLLYIFFLLRYLMYHRRSLFDGSMSDDHLSRSGVSESSRFLSSSWRDDMEIIILQRGGFFLRRADFRRRRRWLFFLRRKKINIASFEDKQQTYDDGILDVEGKQKVCCLNNQSLSWSSC